MEAAVIDNDIADDFPHMRFKTQSGVCDRLVQI